LWTALLAGTFLSLIMSYRIASRALVLGDPKGRWIYEYLYGFRPQSLVVFAIVCACCGVVAMVPLAEVRHQQWRVVAMWLIVGCLSQALLRQLTPYSLEQMFVSDGSSGFYSATLQYGPAEILRGFDRLRPTFASVHARGNMPGKVLLVHALEVVTARPAVLAWLVVVLSNAGGIFLYLFVRDFLADRETALISLVFYLFVPAKLVFFPILNTVTPVMLLACAWLWMRLLQSRDVKYAVALGVAIYGLVLYEPTPLVTGLLFGLLTAQALWRGDVEWHAAAVSSAIIILAFVATYAAIFAWFHFDLVTTLRNIAADAVVFNSGGNRPYRIWVSENLFDFFFGAGICQAFVFCISVVGALDPANLRGSGTAGRLAAFYLGTAAALMAADLLGLNRGEVVRLWIFLACFAQVPAAHVCARLGSRGAVMLVLGATLLQDALSTAMFAFAQP